MGWIATSSWDYCPPRLYRSGYNLRIMSDCVEWKGFINRSGYGSTYYQGVRITVHRMIWRLKRGPIPNGMYVLHSCDNKKCYNVDHLFLGSAKDNHDDAVRKGRKP